MITDLFDLILEGAFTQTECLRRLRLLKEQATLKIFGGSVNPDPNIPPLSVSDLSDEEQAWLSKAMAFISLHVTKDNLYQTFIELEKAIKKIEVLNVFLPFEMPRDEVKRLGLYLRQTYGKNFLMEIKFDPKLIAGTALSWKGIYKDYSLHQRMLDNQIHILDTLKKCVKQEQKIS